MIRVWVGAFFLACRWLYCVLTWPCLEGVYTVVGMGVPHKATSPVDEGTRHLISVSLCYLPKAISKYSHLGVRASTCGFWGDAIQPITPLIFSFSEWPLGRDPEGFCFHGEEACFLPLLSLHSLQYSQIVIWHSRELCEETDYFLSASQFLVVLCSLE